MVCTSFSSEARTHTARVVTRLSHHGTTAVTYLIIILIFLIKFYFNLFVFSSALISILASPSSIEVHLDICILHYCVSRWTQHTNGILPAMWTPKSSTWSALSLEACCACSSCLYRLGQYSDLCLCSNCRCCNLSSAQIDTLSCHSAVKVSDDCVWGLLWIL